ncbi:MAG: phosphoribosylaminoimidazolesuccinocarboxamide synthase [Armatimonadota bacterium]
MTSSAPSAVVSTDLPVPLLARGKVRDVYALDGMLLIVATDRISAFDHILPTPVPGKGRILTQLSAFWFDRTRAIIPNHLIATDPARMPEALREHAAVLDGRAMLVRRARRLDVECVVRGYLAGSAWADYRRERVICGVELPAGLEEGDRLAMPIFTPATKASAGHDENISFEAMRDLVGDALAVRLRDVSVALYEHAHAYAAACGLLLADTKFEFGLIAGPSGDELTLIDEALTPDSSRYWDASDYARTRSLVPLDKQYVRNYLLQIGWNREPPVPSLPSEVVAATQERYRETYRRLTGKEPV